MRVDIEHVEKKVGLLFKETLHGVQVHVVFSEEELQIIGDRNLFNDIVLERGPSRDLRVRDNDTEEMFFLRIRDLTKGPDTYFVQTPAEAKEYEGEITDILPKLKAYIMENAEIAPEERKKTLEF